MSNENKNENVFEIKPYTKKDLRIMYGLPESTFRRWLKEVPETSDTGSKNWLTVIQVEAIIKKYGIPNTKISSVKNF